MPFCVLPFETAYWVVDGVLAAGPHPGGGFEPAPADVANRFLSCNVRHFVDLTAKREFEPYIPAWGRVNGRLASELFSYRQFPIHDFSLPSKKQAVEILDYIDAKAEEHTGAVYVHCYAGLGRTGTIVGIYLARHGIAEGKGALAKLNELRAEIQKTQHWYSSPQNHSQMRMVASWKKGE